MNLSPHFTLEEFTLSQTAVRKGINNRPNDDMILKLKSLAHSMEEVRELLGGHRLIISSAYRSYALNTAVGGSLQSAHCRSEAVDFICPDFGIPLAICYQIEAESDLAFDQLIYEHESWVHLSFSPQFRHQLLTIDVKGTRFGLPPRKKAPLVA